MGEGLGFILFLGSWGSSASCFGFFFRFGFRVQDLGVWTLRIYGTTYWVEVEGFRG